MAKAGMRISHPSKRVPPNISLTTETLLRDIQNHTNFAIIEADEKGVIQTFNAGAERLLGYSAIETVGKLSPCDFCDEQEAITRAAALSLEIGMAIPPFRALTATASRGVEHRCELTYVRKSGRRFPADVTIAALRDDQERIIGYSFISADISLRRRAADAAALEILHAEVEVCREGLELCARERAVDQLDRDKLFRQIAANIPEALWVQESGVPTIRYINSAWERITRRPIAAGDALCKLYEAFHPQEIQQVRAALEESPKGGVSFECRILLPDGITRWVCFRTFPLVGLDGETHRIAGTLDDITDRKEESERVERLKSEFVSTVSHELRTPLTSIAGSLGLLVGNAAGKLPESALRLIKIAQTNSQRLVRLIGDILDIEKLESGKVLYHFKRLEVKTLVEQSIMDMGGFAQNYGVHIRLSDASVSAEVYADRDRLVQVFTNLLSNAVKFSPRNAEVVVSIERAGNKVRISVRDHGHGIPQEFRSHVFEKFAQAPTSDARQMGGTGLGLSIVQQIVARFDGEVGFVDTPGGGTTFHVALPDWDHLGRARSSIDGRSDCGRILLCEDDPNVAIVLCERLWLAGFATDVAYSANDAAQHAAATTYAAILVDLHLPDGDGVKLIQQLRAQPQCYNTLLVVASADPSRIQDGSELTPMLNILDWLDKPVDASRLVRVLDRLIVPGASPRPRVLHVDDDDEMIRAVAQSLNGSAEIMSVASIDGARRALAANRFDVAVLNVALAGGSGLDLLLDLRDLCGEAIPVVVFSILEENTQFASRLYAGLTKSRASVDGLVETLRKHAGGRPLHVTNDGGVA